MHNFGCAYQSRILIISPHDRTDDTCLLKPGNICGGHIFFAKVAKVVVLLFGKNTIEKPNKNPPSRQ